MRNSIFFLVFSIPFLVFSQEEKGSISTKDSIQVYYIDKTDMLLLKPYLLYKENSIEVSNKGSHIKLSPNSPLALGLGLNYKWIGIAAGYGLPHTSRSITNRGKTTQFDIQMNIYSSRFGGDGHLRYYKGYYNSNPQDFLPWDKEYYPKIQDMKTISFGAHLYYVFNHKKFSNKAYFSRSQIQTKSAGSMILGYFFNYDEVDSPQGFIPQEFPDSVARDLDIHAFKYFATGFSMGYLHTWVVSKHFFFNTGLVPGFGYKDIKITNSKGEQEQEKKPHGQIEIRANLGYEGDPFYAGFSGMILLRNINYGDYNINMASEQIRFYVGRRFGLKKKKKNTRIN